jgi:hypothetical protein
MLKLKQTPDGSMSCLQRESVTARTAAKFILAMVAIVLIADVLFFLAWSLSGQKPADDMFMGTITTKVVKMIK